MRLQTKDDQSGPNHALLNNLYLPNLHTDLKRIADKRNQQFDLACAKCKNFKPNFLCREAVKEHGRSQLSFKNGTSEATSVQATVINERSGMEISAPRTQHSKAPSFSFSVY